MRTRSDCRYRYDRTVTRVDSPTGRALCEISHPRAGVGGGARGPREKVLFLHAQSVGDAYVALDLQAYDSLGTTGDLRPRPGAVGEYELSDIAALLRSRGVTTSKHLIRAWLSRLGAVGSE